jgi:hypothetical protein
MAHFRVHFEPEDCEADNLDQVTAIMAKRKKFITIRKIVPVDEMGFPITDDKVKYDKEK